LNSWGIKFLSIDFSHPEHKVTLNITARLRDSSGQTAISQSWQYIRYMYVNVGGD